MYTPLPAPDFYACPKNGKVMSVHSYQSGEHSQGPMRGNYEPVYYGETVRAALAVERERCARAFEAEVDTWDEMKKAGFHGAIRRKGAAAIRALNPDGSTP